MAIADDLDRILKDSMRARDQRRLDVVRMLKSRLAEAVTAKGFSGPVDDALLVRVIDAYRRQMQKAVPELEKAGARGAQALEVARFEVDFCEGFLPTRLGDDELRVLVVERLAALAVTDPKQAGKVVGDLMRTHKGLADAGAVKRIVEELLGG